MKYAIDLTTKHDYHTILDKLNLKETFHKIPLSYNY
jgi:hypothetical protein